MGNAKYEPNRSQNASSKGAGRSDDVMSRHQKREDDIVRRVVELAAAKQYRKGLELLNGSGNNPRILNAKGVVLLRMGQSHEAVRIFRGLVLNHGCTWMRKDIPTTYKTNYAMALLLDGHPTGCVEMLDELNDELNPTVKQLRGAIEAWRSKLTLWQKLNWRFGNIEPKNCQVPIDFEPGDFENIPRPESPPHPVAPQPPRQAA